MAAQTEAPDDLIAELARLMADDAKTTPPAGQEQSKPVRIPGSGTAAAPVPRFDFSASSNLASNQAPTSPVRIPGNEAAKADAADAFNFNFDFAPSATTKSAPAPQPQAPASVAPASAPSVAPQAASPVVAPRAAEPTPAVDESAMLDQDSLADLIAAELAADMDPEPEPEPEVQPQQQTVRTEPVPERATGPDNFGVPPVFGLGSARPAPAVATQVPKAEPAPEPVADRPVQSLPPASRNDEPADPLEEIERLVAPAVRMNVASTPAPTLRSLATPVAVEPVIAEPRKPEPEARTRPSAPAQAAAVDVSSVDEAILAAAAATGAHVEWVNGNLPDDPIAADEVEPMPAPRRAGFRMSRAVAGPLVAVSLLAVAGFGLYWMLGQGGQPSGPAPLLTADTTPTKEVPEVDTTASAQQSVVFNEISGANTGEDEQIVSRDQADTEAVVAANASTGTPNVISSGENTVDANQDGLVNRKVRTVTVRPDGTIVSGDDSLAGSAMLPVDRPNVPNVPGADFSTPDLVANATADAQAAAAAPAATVTPAAPATPVVEPGSVVPVVDASGTPVSGRSVTIPMQRPTDFAAMSSAALSTAATAPAATAQPAAAVPATTGSTPITTTPATAAAYVQLASQRSEADAQATVQAINTRYGVLFGGAAPEIRRVDLGERGIYYRVVVPAASREGAANICTNIKAAGGDCLLL